MPIYQDKAAENSKEEIMAQREAKKKAKQVAKKNKKKESKVSEEVLSKESQEKDNMVYVHVKEDIVKNDSNITQTSAKEIEIKSVKPEFSTLLIEANCAPKSEEHKLGAIEGPSKEKFTKLLESNMKPELKQILHETEDFSSQIDQHENDGQIQKAKQNTLIDPCIVSLKEKRPSKPNKSREEIMAEREMRKKVKVVKKEGKTDKKCEDQGDDEDNLKRGKIVGIRESIKETPQGLGSEGKPKEKSKAELKAERRALQERQRAAKETVKQTKPSGQQKIPEDKKCEESYKSKEQTSLKEKKTIIGPKLSRVKLFEHLQYKQPPLDIKLELDMHPAVVALGAKYAARVINGSNARCLAFLQAIKEVITDYITPPEKEFSRGLEEQIDPVVKYLKKFRPFSVSINNALRHIKSHLTQLPNNVTDDEARTKLCDVIEIYIREQINVAALAISKKTQRKIANGDVILTFACSSLLCQLLVESKMKGTDFSVIVVDAGPWFEGRELLRRLTDNGISCTYVLINALSFIMRKVTTVLIGAHALLANGYVMSRAGSSLVALMAHSYNVPVLVCCETHKFSERVQTDAFAYIELGDPDDIIGKGSILADWRSWPSLSPLNLLYDITPPDLVTAVVTELAILPCTSVPVVLRVKPSDVAT